MTQAPYQSISSTSRDAAASVDKRGSGDKQARLLRDFMERRGTEGATLFEAAEFLTAALGYDIPSSSASARMNTLTSDEKCRKQFGCDALVIKTGLRRNNPATKESGGVYMLKRLSGGVPVPARQGAGGGCGKEAAAPQSVPLTPQTGTPPQLDFGFGKQLPSVRV